MILRTEMNEDKNNGFREYRLKILGDIQRQNDSLSKLQDIVTTLAIEVGQLKMADKVRSGVWGSVGGAVSAAVLTMLINNMI